MILAILFAYLGYKKANEAGKNGILWALLAGGSFVATQLIVALGIGIIIGLGIAGLGWSEELLTSYEIVVTIVALIFSIGVAFGVLKLAERNPIEETMTAPPPPTTFDL